MSNRLLLIVLLSALTFPGCGLFGPSVDYFPTGAGSSWAHATIAITNFGGVFDTVTGRVVVEAEEPTELNSGEECVPFFTTESTFMTTPDTVVVTKSTRYLRKTGSHVLVYDSLADPAPETLLALPLKVDRDWTVAVRGDTVISAAAVGQETVSVPAGEYVDCWKVKLTFTVGSTSQASYAWYADGVGQVRTVLEFGTLGASYSLRTELVSADVR